MSNTKCAICFIPPESELEFIQNIRQEHDSAFSRWMPHVNLVFPFLPTYKVGAIREQLKKELAKLKPFEMKFQKFSHFPKKGFSTVHVVPECDDNQINQIYDIILKVTGLLPEKEFHPHMTVGQFPTAETDAWLAKLEQQFEPFSYLCNSIYVVERDEDTPFRITSVFKLGVPESKPAGVKLPIITTSVK